MWRCAHRYLVAGRPRRLSAVVGESLWRVRSMRAVCGCVCAVAVRCGRRCECAKYVWISIAIDAFDVNISRGPMRHERDGVRQVSWHVGVCRASMWRDCDCAAMCVHCVSVMCMQLCVCASTHSHSYTCSQVIIHDAGRSSQCISSSAICQHAYAR